MNHVEEREFNLRLVLRAEFSEAYEGELDGYVWAEEIEAIAGDVVRSAIATLKARPGWKLHAGNRGRAPEDEITLVLERVVE